MVTWLEEMRIKMSTNGSECYEILVLFDPIFQPVWIIEITERTFFQHFNYSDKRKSFGT